MIKIERLSKRYGEVVAVSDLSLDVERGQVVALLGPNGSGKSTTLKSVVSLVMPTSGRIVIDGIEVAGRREEALGRLSYLPQRLSFPESLTGLEILDFYARLRRLPASAIDAAVSLAGLNGTFSRPVGEYSGGMVQRLGLAVLSLPDVPVMLLDEPTAGLDPDGIRRFNEWLDTQRRRGKTILFTTHRLDDAEELADRVAILVKGRLVANMTATELRERESVEVRLKITNWQPRFKEALERGGAEVLCSDERGDLVFAARGGQAVEIMNALRQEGAEILRFTSRSNLESFYYAMTSEKRGE